MDLNGSEKFLNTESVNKKSSPEENLIEEDLQRGRLVKMSDTKRRPVPARKGRGMLLIFW